MPTTATAEPATGWLGRSGLALSTACLAGTLEDKIDAAGGAGFTSLEVLHRDLLLSASSPRALRARAAEAGVGLDVLQPLHVEALAPGAFPALLRRASGLLRTAGELGAATLVLCSTRTDDGVDDDALAAEQLAVLADHATEHGVRLALEAVPWGRVATHEHADRLVAAAGHPGLGVCLDAVHLLSGERGADVLADLDVSRVAHVQLADLPHRGTDDRARSLHHRVFPGQGDLGVAELVRALGERGWSGPVALEVFNDVHQQEDPRWAAIGAMRATHVLAEAVGRLAGPGPATHLLGAAPPPAPEVRGWAFVEIAVDDVSGPVVADTLTTLGLRRTARHRSKPVDLWERGEVRLLLNHAPQRAVEPATASICALAVDTADPGAHAARASSMLAPRLPRLRGDDELDLHSVGAPDGTAVFFCDPTSPHPWSDDFVATGPGDGAEPPGPDDGRPGALLGVDHVSLTESIGDFDQTALFWGGVLGLTAGGSQEVTAPFGLVRSWSAADPAGRLRIRLDTAPLRRGDWAPAVSSPQRVALRTDDAVACARALREAGAPLVSMPDNYYDDLAVRSDLPDDLVASLRELSVLHDRDEHGDYLHFFTAILGSRLFLEVVQRIGGYAGLGAPESTALRMTAHRGHRLQRLVSRAHDDGSPASPASAGVQEPTRGYSLAHLTALSLSPPDLVEAAAAGGYRWVGLRLTRVTTQEPHYPLTHDPALMRATRTRLAATGVEVLDVELARLGSSDRPRDYLRFLEAGAELGARHVITQLPDADLARKTDNFAELCDLAAPLGLSIDLEFPSWTETPDLREAVRVLRAADRPNAGLLVDLLHFARSGSSIDDLRDLPPRWFNLVHVCDAPAEVPTTVEALVHTARFERLDPGDGGIDTHAILAALPAGLPRALEIPHARRAVQLGAREHARLALQATRRHLDAVAQRS